MGDVKQMDGAAASQSGAPADGDAGLGDAIVRKKRKLAAGPAWSLSDLTTALSLVLLLVPAWVLSERLWAPLARARMGLTARFKRGTLRAIRSTGKSVRAALGDRDAAGAEAIVRGLKEAVYEMRLQDLRAWRPGGWNPPMTLEGEEHLRSALAGGKGAILWLAPFVFNSGPTKIILHQRGYRVSHLSSPKHGISETRFGIAYLNRIRCLWEDRHLAQRIVFDRAAPSTAMRRMVRALKAGEIVSIVAASTEGSDMVKGPVFSGRLPVAVGAPRLAALTGAPLLPVFTVRDSRLGFRIAIETPIEIAPGLTSDERCIAATAEFLRRSEPWVRRFPEQWRAWSKWRAE